MHLVIDGYGADASKLQDPELVRQFLDQFPDAIGMTKITQPSVILYHGPQPQDWGVSGFVIIAESHISVHTFPGRCFIQVDIFSCKEFATGEALGRVEQFFGLQVVNTWLLERGLEHYSPEQARRALEVDRQHLAREVRS
ncbi:MAG: S-adenosylmethionine decarboxylase [Chloroflexi bacterium]|nr:S-adenosylmethionine decarboxylase [Chloroflexota bacterium]